MATPIDVDRVQDVTAEHLGGVASQASRFELAAFQMAVYEYAQAVEVPLWTAILLVYDGGHWREVVAERCWSKWQIALCRTEEEREQGRVSGQRGG